MTAQLCASCGGWVDEDCSCEEYLQAVIREADMKRDTAREVDR